jgi:hypothetical protein
MQPSAKSTTAQIEKKTRGEGRFISLALCPPLHLVEHSSAKSGALVHQPYIVSTSLPVYKPHGRLERLPGTGGYKPPLGKEHSWSALENDPQEFQ